jgi:predicted CxxxxCH...CXXCH cytochrome family protein
MARGKVRNIPVKSRLLKAGLMPVFLVFSMFLSAIPAMAGPLTHNSANTNSIYWNGQGGWGVPGGKYGEFTCATCHTRTTQNIKRVVESIPDTIGAPVNKQVKFKNVTAFGDDGDNHTASLHICEVCHTQTSVHKYGSTDPGNLNHMNANLGDCMSCHPHSAGFKPFGCTDCHGHVATSSNPIATGKHTAHIANAGVLGTNYACETCHAKTVAGDTNLIDVTRHNNGMKDYSGVRAGGSSTYLTATGVCSAAYCHSDGKGRQKDMALTGWNSSATFDCKGCHGSDAAPAFTSQAGEPNYVNGGAGAVDANNHEKHVIRLGGSSACQNCHADTVVGTSLKPGGKHTSKTRDVLYGNGNVFSYNQGIKTCSTISCHDPGNLLTTEGSVQWGSDNANCTLCHGNETTAAANLSGAHNSHLNQAPQGGMFTCKECHAPTITNSDNRTIATVSNHLNGLVNYSGANSGKNKNCSNFYCHSNGRGTFANPPTWTGGGTVNCFTCHPQANLSGSHGGHLGKNVSCLNCHNTTTNNGTSITGATHINRSIDMANGGNFFNQTVGFSPAGFAPTTCNAISCHFGSNATWGQALGCTSCHGNDATSGNPIASGKHTAHIDNAAVIGANFGCVECHAKTVSDNTTVSNETNHRNSFADYSGAKSGDKSAFAVNIAPGACSNVYCHSDGKGIFKSMTTNNWRSTATFDCKGCHGSDASPAFASTAGEPNYVSAGVGVSRSNSHETHVGDASSCVRCHAKTTSTGTAIIAGSTTHLNKGIDVRLSKSINYSNYSGTYSLTTKTCSTTYCHGSTSAVWGATGTLNCDSCHSGNNALAGAHSLHYASATVTSNYAAPVANNGNATTYLFTCSSCHGGNASNHSTGPIVLGSDADVFFRYTAMGKTGPLPYVRTNNPGNVDARGFQWSYGANGSCNTTYCHSDGKGGNGHNATINWASASTATCQSCHGNVSDANTLSGAHGSHVNNAATGTALGCVECHAKTVSGSTTVADKTKHVNKFVDFSGAKAGRVKNCSNIYCHSNGQGTFVNPPTWASAADLDCQGCHTNAGLSMAHTTHLNHGATCDNCHSSTTTTGTTITGPANHVNRTVERVAGGTYQAGGNVSFNPTGFRWTTCSNISCHTPYGGGSAPPAAWNDKLDCAFCHPDLTEGHGVHVGALTLATDVTFYNFTANRTPGTTDATRTYGFGCANCHPMNFTKHLNGSLDIDMSRNVAGVGSIRFKNASTATYNSGARTCSNIYCHSTGSRLTSEVAYSTTPAWNQTFAGIGGDRCAKCHGNMPDTGAHEPHKVGIHFDNVYDFVNGGKVPQRGPGGNSSHGDPAQETIISCYICHNNTITVIQNDQAYSLYSTAQIKVSNGCNSCHGSSAGLKGNASLNNISFHVNGRPDVAFAPIKVKSKAQIRPESFHFYSGVWQRNAYKNYSSQGFDIAKQALNTATMYAPGAPEESSCSNIACHNGNFVKWDKKNWDNKNKCAFCHTML